MDKDNENGKHKINDDVGMIIEEWGEKIMIMRIITGLKTRILKDDMVKDKNDIG